MLHSIFFSFDFARFCQCGCYFDFFYKKCTEMFVRNVFIYSSQFFAEKYMIEYLTRRIIDKIIYVSNKWLGWSKLSYSTFFIQILTIIFYSLSVINIIYIII